MNIGDELIVGRMGQQPMHIADSSVDPQHAILRKKEDGTFQIEDKGSTSGVFVFGMRIKRKTMQEDTPVLLGKFKTSVQQLLQDASSVNLQKVWDEYEAEKRKWDRRTMMVNYIRILPTMITMLVGILLGQNMENGMRMGITLGLTLAVLVISMVASERIVAKKNIKMAELNTEMQKTYVCPHCHRPLPLTPYAILKQNTYCPNPACSYPLP